MNQGGQDKQLAALEQAIMARAQHLAGEFQDKAERQRDHILRDAAERLHNAEEREVMVAKSEAERLFRRVTQASELKLQGRLDQLRWELVQAVQGRLGERLRDLRDDPGRYRDWLIRMISEAAQLLPDGDLTAEINADDLVLLGGQWPELAAEAAPGRNIRLSEKPTWGSGGVRLRSADNHAQVDNRFEGRLARLEAEVQRVILQQLFPNDISAGARSGGPQ